MQIFSQSGVGFPKGQNKEQPNAEKGDSEYDPT